MARLIWDNLDERYFETGISQGVLFLKNDDGTYQTGVSWSGLVGVSESYTGGNAVHVYASDAQYNDIFEPEEVDLTIKAYSYPNEFEQCSWFSKVQNIPLYLGGQDPRRFAVCYKTKIGNFEDPTGKYNRIYILYDCVVESFEKDYSTMSATPELLTLSYNIKTRPVPFSNYKHTPILVLDSRKDSFQKIERYLYGSTSIDSTLLMPDEIISALGTHYLVTEDYDPITFGGTRILI